ncbi:probable ATP-dependent RNA helicase DDX31 [Liolophura sinensis]|uniref:probable ATP-dependent RNA helicase DDX31 n=1 Tax=Liolophura sinensis TaxID=3198878 RepID=UPI003159887A
MTRTGASYLPSRETPRTYQEAATFFQLKMEEDVHHDKELFQLSQKAYQSFVKAYATYPAHLKSIFHVKNLHLGHLAKSFALRDTPKDIGIGFSKIMASLKHKRKRDINKITFREGETAKKQRTSLMSEFSSGSKGRRKAFSGPGVRKRKKARK